MSSGSSNPVWQDREIRFDLPMNQLAMRRGEKVIDSINAVEDTKGNNGERGAFSVTNLRIIWCSHKNPKVNLSTLLFEDSLLLSEIQAFDGCLQYILYAYLYRHWS